MERSISPTNRILINAHSTINLCIDFFGIIELTESFRSILQQRLYIVDLLTTDKSFHNLSYWDSCCTFYCDQESKLYAETVIPPGEDWTFVSLEPREEELLISKEDLEAHQLMIAKNGYANFKALNKYINEVYMTETISIKDLLKSFISRCDDTS